MYCPWSMPCQPTLLLRPSYDKQIVKTHIGLYLRDHLVVQLLEAARQAFRVEGRRRDNDARHADRLERLQLLDSRPAHARQLYFARVASGLIGLGFHDREQFLELGNFPDSGDEAVAIASRAFGGRRRMAADMNWHASFLHRPGVALDRAEVEMFAVE